MAKEIGSFNQRIRRANASVCYPLALLILCGALAGCRRQEGPRGGTPPSPAVTEPVVFPELGEAQRVEPGIVRHEVALGRGGLFEDKVWVYLPEKPGEAKLPCVLIAPAGSTLTVGMNLDKGDMVEHLPYVRAGFAVVAFAISGGLADIQKATDNEFFNATRAFMAVEGGWFNAKQALDFALARVPSIDAGRIYIAGHSSAGTLSLFFAERESRLKGCIAFAPATDVVKRLGPKGIASVNQNIPGFAAFITRTSPITSVARLHCPLFLFHAQDDTNTPIADSRTFIDELRKTNQRVTFIQWPRGGHYDSMIKEGVPQAIRWLKALPAQ